MSYVVQQQPQVIYAQGYYPPQQVVYQQPAPQRIIVVEQARPSNVVAAQEAAPSLPDLLNPTAKMTITETEALLYLTDSDAPVCKLDAKKHFDALSEKEALYAHYINKASWAGFSVLNGQMSAESSKLVKMFSAMFKAPGDKLVSRDLDSLKATSKLSDEDWTHFLEYAVQVLYNGGNYKSFGDTKFVPRVPQDKFEAVVKAAGVPEALTTFNNLKSVIYAMEPKASLLLGYVDEGHVSGYYGSNVTRADIDLTQAFLESKGIHALNTRLFKAADGTLEVRFASAITKTEEHTHEGKKIRFVHGDFQHAMKLAAEAMRSAVQYAANPHQKTMVEKYAESFETGDMEAHRDSQRAWIKDVGPVVECNVGFVETYKDPAGVRAEWEGFVAVVNKEMTAKFEQLVNKAHDIILRLPWGPDFEKDKFNRPDFTSLEVVSFATSGSPPAGINIPNYDDIRMTQGFKNVSLGNVLNASAPSEALSFVAPEDEPLFRKLRGEAFEVQVGLHELLGHGSGKLLTEEPAGEYNFDIKNPPVNPLTGEKVKTWYKPGETWGSKFGPIAAAYEECRAESVAMALICERDVLEIFGAADHAEDVYYIGYLLMARMGFMALEFYSPSSQRWGQAHCQARYGIFREFLRCGVASVELSAKGDDAIVRVHRDKILSHGVPAVRQFLNKLAIYKATGNAEEGVKWFREATSVPEDWLKYRDIVIKKKLPRKIFVQGNTSIVNGKAVFKEYPATLEGFVHSFIERDLYLA
ncbi:hypothetical protein HK101_005613 [Irineochytrium annulatum]|nr:hypothetical protein HK101_005613 [Irineochytrium annulatum]